MARCGITALARRRPVDLSTGQRRLVELARAVAGDSRMLLLDEPSSGLDRSETVAFGEILRGLVRDEGRGLLLVEHDMSLVMSICDYVYVLDFGRPIFEGTAGRARARARSCAPPTWARTRTRPTSWRSRRTSDADLEGC